MSIKKEEVNSKQNGESGDKLFPYNSRIVYIGHLPHGFYEKEMKGYFSQFGRVTGVNIPQSSKTNRPKGYAFVQFSSAEVAKIAAETMDGYLFEDRVLKCHVLTDSRFAHMSPPGKIEFPMITDEQSEEERLNKFRGFPARQRFYEQREMVPNENLDRRYYNNVIRLATNLHRIGYVKPEPTEHTGESTKAKTNSDNHKIKFDKLVYFPLVFDDDRGLVDRNRLKELYVKAKNVVSSEKEERRAKAEEQEKQGGKQKPKREKVNGTNNNDSRRQQNKKRASKDDSGESDGADDDSDSSTSSGETLSPASLHICSWPEDIRVKRKRGGVTVRPRKEVALNVQVDVTTVKRMKLLPGPDGRQRKSH